MPAGLQPTTERPVVDQEDSFALCVEDERRCGHMAGKGAAGMNVIPIPDLPPQESMTLLRHVERTRMPVQNRFYMLSEGRSVEARRRGVHRRSALHHLGESV